MDNIDSTPNKHLFITGRARLFQLCPVAALMEMLLVGHEFAQPLLNALCDLHAVLGRQGPLLNLWESQLFEHFLPFPLPVERGVLITGLVSLACAA